MHHIQYEARQQQNIIESMIEKEENIQDCKHLSGCEDILIIKDKGICLNCL